MSRFLTMHKSCRHSLPAALAIACTCCFSQFAAALPAPYLQTYGLAAEQQTGQTAETAPAVEHIRHSEQNGHDGQDGHTYEATATEPHGEGDGHNGAGHRHGGDDGHHGQTVALFGKEIGGMGQFSLKLLNFLIFAVLIFMLLKGVLKAAFRARATEIETKLAQSECDRLEGEAQMRGLEAKMAGLEEDLRGIMAKAEVEAEAEKQRIIETARAEADQILAQAKSEIEHQWRAAEKELRGLVARLAVEGAEQRLRQSVGGSVAAEMMDRAIQRVGGEN